MRITVLALIFAMLMTTVCFADVFTEAGTVMTKVTSGIRNICVVSAVLAGTIACMIWMFGTSQKTIDLAAFWGKRIVIGLILIGLMSSLVNTFYGYTNGGSTSFAAAAINTLL